MMIGPNAMIHLIQYGLPGRTRRLALSILLLASLSACSDEIDVRGPRAAEYSDVGVGADESLSPVDGLVTYGPPHGPFAPAGKDYVLTNSSAVDLNYQLEALAPWVVLSGPEKGTVLARQSIQFTVLLDPSATVGLSPGTHSTLVTVRDLDSGTVLQQRDVELSITSGGFGSPSLLFSTFLGGANAGEETRDVAVDAAGNIYIAGGAPGDDFPTTPGAYDRTYNTGGNQTGSAGQCDGFVAKFTPDGQLVWATYVGGINYDRFYSIEVHTDGTVYLSARAGPGFPVTPGAFQTEYKGSDAGIYGIQNGAIVKLAADGSGIIWSSYVGSAHLIRDFDIDQNGDVYIKIGTNAGSSSQTEPSWFHSAFANAYQEFKHSARETGVMKVSSDGSQVLWATWFGGSGIDTEEGSLVVDDAGRPYILFNTNSTDLPTTPGVPGPNKSGGNDVFLARFSADGSALELGTYLGGNGLDDVETHGLAVTADSVVALFTTTSSNLQTTPGAFQSTWAGNQDAAAVKLSLDGALLASTYVGGSGEDETDGLAVTPDGHVLYVGQSDSTDLPVTPDAYQSTPTAGEEGYIVRLSPDLSTVIYCTYMGGESFDNLRAAVFDGYDFIVSGGSSSNTWPTLNAHQPDYAGSGRRADIILAKLSSGAVGVSCTTAPCNSCPGTVASTSGGEPTLGNSMFTMELFGAPSDATYAILAVGEGACSSPGLPGACAPVLVPEPWLIFGYDLTPASGTCTTRLSQPAPIPNVPSLAGLSVSFQWGISCSGTPSLLSGQSNCATVLLR